MHQQQKSWLQIGNILFLIGTIVLNGLSNGALRDGVSIGSLSDKYFTLFTPAGITFSIWGLIYLALIAFAIFQARDLFSSQKIDMPWLERISVWFMVSCVFNSLWLVAWLFENVGLSLLFMIGLLGSLVTIYVSLHIGLREEDRKVKYFVHLPFSLYLGWVNVATIANVSSLLVAEGWEVPFGDSARWTVTMVIIASTLGVLTTGIRNDIVFGGVFVWALLGIIIKHQQMGADGLLSVQLSAGIGIFLILATAVLNTLRQRKRNTELGYV